MSWTSPRTWVTGETPSAATCNTHVRDNVQYLYDNQFRGARAVLSANQSISNSTETSASWGSAPIDTDGLWSGGSPTRLTVPAVLAGQVEIRGWAEFAAAASGYRYAKIRKNGATDIAYAVNNHKDGSSARTVGMAVATADTAAAADYYELRVFQTSGGALNITAAACFLHLVFRGA